jgi:hypothetical protein
VEKNDRMALCRHFSKQHSIGRMRRQRGFLVCLVFVMVFDFSYFFFCFTSGASPPELGRSTAERGGFCLLCFLLYSVACCSVFSFLNLSSYIAIMEIKLIALSIP